MAAAWTRDTCPVCPGWAGVSLAFLSKTQRILVHCEISISSCCRLCCMHKPFCCQQGYCQTLTAIEKVWIFRINIYWLRLHSTGWTRHRCSWALPTYHGTQHSQHTEVKLILYNYVLSAVSRVWLVSYISLLELQPDLGRALHQHNCQWGFLCELQNLARICAYHTLASSGRG